MNRTLLFIVALFLSVSASFAQQQTVQVNRILGDDFVVGQTPDVSSGAFTFAMRVKLLGQATARGNDGTNGMFFSVASGWYDGIRAYYSLPSQHVVFNIGRVEQQSAISVESKSAVIAGVTHDIVCTYDGKVMRLYIDGVLDSEKEYTGSIETKSAPIKVGNGGYGVGANRMYVDQLDFYPKALSDKEIADRFDNHFSAEEKKTLTILKQYVSTYGAHNPAVTNDVIDQILAIEDLPDSLRQQALQDRLYASGYTPQQRQEFIKEEVKSLLDMAVTENEPVQIQTQRDVRIWNVFWLLKDTPQSDLLTALKDKYPKQFAEIQDIVKLKDSAQRVRNLETQALQQANVLREITFTVYISATGSDTASGTADAPVCSLEKALELVQAWQSKQSDKKKYVAIVLAGGVYSIQQTIHLENVENVIITSADGQRAVLTGAKTLTQFKPVTDSEILNRLPENVRSRVVECDLKSEGVTDFGRLQNRGYHAGVTVNPVPSLFVNGEGQILARYPNVGEELLKFGTVKGSTFGYDTDRPNHWKLSDNPAENDIWANGLFQWEWASNTRKITNIDREHKTMTVDYQELKGRFHFYLLNILEELDVPGEYYVDRQQGKLYYLPSAEECNSNGEFKANVEFSVLNERFFDMNRCKNVVVENVTIKGGRESGLMLQDCVNCYVTDSTLEQLGGHGIVIQGGSFCGILNSRLRELGSFGVQLYGGDRATLTPAGHIVHNCEISDFTRIERCYAPAVKALGCGFVITNNLVYDSPHHAFRTDGNDIYLARNEVHSVVYEFSDQSGVDIYCDPTYRGIVIEENFWHDIQGKLALCGQAGIRLDDSISGVIMLNNVFYRSSGGMFGGIQIHGGHDNLCFGNVFVDCTCAFSFSPWGNDRYKTFVQQQYPKFVNSPIYLETYPTMNRILEHPNRNYIIHNRAINCDEFQRRGNQWDIFVDNMYDNSVLIKEEQRPQAPSQCREWIQTIPSVPNLDKIGTK